MGFGGVKAVQGWEPSPGITSRCQLTAPADAITHPGSAGCYPPHPGSPIGEFPGILPEGLAELPVGGLEVPGQRLGRVPQGGQAQLPLQPLVGAALSRAGMRREWRVRAAGFDRQGRGLREGKEVTAAPAPPSPAPVWGPLPGFRQSHPGFVAGGVSPVGAARLGQGDHFPDEVADLLEGAIGIFPAVGNDGPGGRGQGQGEPGEPFSSVRNHVTARSAQMGLTVLAVVLREITSYSLENSQERIGTASSLGAAT